MICTQCEIDKPEMDFSLRSSKTGKRQKRCKKCVRSYCKNHYDNNKDYYADKRKSFGEKSKAYLDKLKEESSCIICGEEHVACLQFHHRDGGEDKDFNVSNYREYSIKRLKVEIDKCDILCANCHFKLHYNQKRIYS